jgi:hypothetical protein
MNSTDKKETRHLLFYMGFNRLIAEHLKPIGFHADTKGFVQVSPSLIYKSQSKDDLEAIQKALVVAGKYNSENFLIVSLP